MNTTYTTYRRSGFRSALLIALAILAGVLAVFLLVDQALPREAGAMPSKGRALRCQPIGSGEVAGDTFAEGFAAVDFRRVSPTMGEWVTLADQGDQWSHYGWALTEDSRIYTTRSCAVRSGLVCWSEGDEIIGAWHGFRVLGPVVPCPAAMVNAIAGIRP